MQKFLFLFIGLFLISCSADLADSEDTILEESYTIENSESILIELGNSPVEGSVTIYQQANFYKVSKIDRNDSGLIYVYTPEEGFTGMDFVEITRSDFDGSEIFTKTITRVSIEVK
ncbi:MAG: hypothetical protein JJE07_01660 [Flavobacteriaceae bacterium]|nr:hypothetical protein [Flavobacteriaceae bacterium]